VRNGLEKESRRRAGDGRVMTDDARKKAEDRKQRAEDRRATTDDGGQKAEDGTSSLIMLGKMINKWGKLTLISRASGTADLSEFRGEEFRQKELCVSVSSARDMGQ